MNNRGIGPKAWFQIFLGVIGVILILYALAYIPVVGEQAIWIGVGFTLVGVTGVAEVGGRGWKIAAPLGGAIIILGVLILAHLVVF